MKLEIIDDNYYKVFINGAYDEQIDYNNKEELGKYIKNIILKLKKMYNIILQGLYEIHVYIIKFFGFVLEIKNIDNYFGKTVDLKIIVHSDEAIYLKVFRYELLEKYKNLKYFNGYFYLDIYEFEKEDIYKFLENSNIIYGDELNEIKCKWLSLT